MMRSGMLMGNFLGLAVMATVVTTTVAVVSSMMPTVVCESEVSSQANSLVSSMTTTVTTTVTASVTASVRSTAVWSSLTTASQVSSASVSATVSLTSVHRLGSHHRRHDQKKANSLQRNKQTRESIAPLTAWIAETHSEYSTTAGTMESGSSDMNYDQDSSAEDGDWPKPVRNNELRARDDRARSFPERLSSLVEVILADDPPLPSVGVPLRLHIRDQGQAISRLQEVNADLVL
ncbi:hypothetical protein AAG570_004161 [Ranatra chinensis]|uniref:Uncharacterized protein n=1 Tax=Ranatra chinensis TaxID=642074 RepID=A0ABD0Y343_9HEMI